ncbi:MAG: methyltransferase domain-containing protein [Thermoplasmatales archaeon]|nr:methyltransferase domain-containing protein [Thermoplasmatales archaeon]
MKEDARAIMFNRKASDKKSKADEIIKAIGLKKGQNIADIGAGGGYFALRFAGLVGEGKVYAVDVNPDLLEFVKKAAEEKGIDNLITILSDGENLNLPEKSLDFIFMRNVTHHIGNRVEYFKKLKKFLKKDGKVIIIEYKKKRFSPFHRHYVAKEVIIKEMEESNYLLEKDFDFLPKQHFTIWKQKIINK